MIKQGERFGLIQGINTVQSPTPEPRKSERGYVLRTPTPEPPFDPLGVKKNLKKTLFCLINILVRVP
jgi:hypothetical protein